AALYEHRHRKTLLRPALFAAIVVPHALYIAWIGGDHFEYRPPAFYFPFLFILLFDGARRLARGTISYAATLVYLGVVLVGLTALPYQSHKQFPESYVAGFPGVLSGTAGPTEFMLPERDPIYRLPGLRQVAQAHRRMLRTATRAFVGIRQEEHRLFLGTVIPEGRRLRRFVEAGLLPADTQIAVDSVGAIPYYSNLRVLDRLGLTDAHVAHSQFTGGPQFLAHDKMANFDYARDAGVDLWALDHVHSLLHVTDDQLLAHIMPVHEQQLPVYVANVGEGYTLPAAAPARGSAGDRTTSHRKPSTPTAGQSRR
ncbi:MAG: hypothetical protein ACYS7M_13890, partial [Planctomycetota bacterium]